MKSTQKINNPKVTIQPWQRTTQQNPENYQPKALTFSHGREHPSEKNTSKQTPITSQLEPEFQTQPTRKPTRFSPNRKPPIFKNLT
jgi:hypothetical protein